VKEEATWSTDRIVVGKDIENFGLAEEQLNLVVQRFDLGFGEAMFAG
jgi:hypothetical protein